MIWTNFSTPFQPAPLPYILLLNPLELACAGMLWFALKSLPEALPLEYRRVNAPGVAALAFMVISAGVMRLWHFYDGITWQLDIMLQSFGLQASLSVVWAVTAIILMVYGNRRKLRPFWITGAALMAIVVIKLFLIEFPTAAASPASPPSSSSACCCFWSAGSRPFRPKRWKRRGQSIAQSQSKGL